MTYRKVLAAIVERWGVVERTAERDIARAYEAIAVEAGHELPQRAARVERGLWRVAHKAEAAMDWKAATSAFKQLSSIYGMDAPKKVEVSGGMTLEQRALLGALSLTNQERLNRIAELEAKATGAPAPASDDGPDEADQDLPDDADTQGG